MRKFEICPTCRGEKFYLRQRTAFQDFMKDSAAEIQTYRVNCTHCKGKGRVPIDQPVSIAAAKTKRPTLSLSIVEMIVKFIEEPNTEDGADLLAKIDNMLTEAEKIVFAKLLAQQLVKRNDLFKITFANESSEAYKNLP